jgi:hypothetical protein
VSELGPSEYIQEFLSGGPKKLPTGSLIKRLEKRRLCNVREFTLNYSAKHLVKFDVIRNIILNPEDDSATVRTEKKIKRKRNRCDGACIQNVTKPEDKKYSVFHQATQTKQ